MRDIDKDAMGQRIRQIRLGAGLRQWELAQKLGTTQSAVHKYEHGVVPEPRRLIELARIGKTSVEWVLTGRHWENGSEEQHRLTHDVLDTASILRQIGEEGRSTVREALEIVREALAALDSDPRTATSDARAAERPLRDHGAETLRLLESAWRIQRAVLNRVARAAEERLSGYPDPSASGRSAADPS